MDEVGKKTEIDLVAGNKTNGGGAKKGRLRFPSLPSCDLIANWCQMSATRRKFGSSGAAERPVPVYLSRASAFLLLSSWSLLPVELRWAVGPPKEGNGSSAGNAGDARLHVEVGGWNWTWNLEDRMVEVGRGLEIPPRTYCQVSSVFLPV